MRKKKKKQARRTRCLVVQHLEKVPRKALEKYQATIRDFVKGKNGVYALYSEDKLYYVGLASNLRSRLRHHLRNRHAASWDTFSVYLTKTDKHIKELETLVLRILDPKGNRQRGKLPDSENLRPEWKSAVKERLDREFVDVVGGGQPQSHRKERSLVRSGRQRDTKKPALAPYVTKRFTIRAFYNGKTYTARVRKNGKIYLRGKLYNSPSYAAIAIVRYVRNGWTFWHFKNTKGEWVKLKELRR